MRLASFCVDGVADFGIVRDDGVVCLRRRTGFDDLRGLLAAGGISQLAVIAEVEAADCMIDDVVWLPVIPQPDKIICVGANYHDHVAEMGRVATERPLLFARFAASQVGHLGALVRPAVSEMFDYEGELAVVIGVPGRHIGADRSLSHVAGYSCYNDGSVRDWQSHTSQFLPGKNFAATGGFGPWMVTADAVDPRGLSLQTRLNGKVVQASTTDLMITDVAAIIAYVSVFTPLAAGDVIVTGTPGGVGAKRTPPLWMRPGDVVEVDISGVGCLRNTVAAEG